MVNRSSKSGKTADSRKVAHRAAAPGASAFQAVSVGGGLPFGACRSPPPRRSRFGVGTCSKSHTPHAMVGVACSTVVIQVARWQLCPAACRGGQPAIRRQTRRCVGAPTVTGIGVARQSDHPASGATSGCAAGSALAAPAMRAARTVCPRHDGCRGRSRKARTAKSKKRADHGIGGTVGVKYRELNLPNMRMNWGIDFPEQRVRPIQQGYGALDRAACGAGHDRRRGG